MKTSAQKPRSTSYFISLVLLVFFVLAGSITDGMRAYAGTPISVSGNFYKIQGDPPDGPPVTRYRLIDDSGKQWSLQISSDDVKKAVDQLSLTQGVGVQISGDQTGENSIDVQTLDTSSGATAGGQSALSETAAMAISGPKIYRTLLCKFNDIAAEPQNLAFFDAMMGDTKPGMNHYWKELSYDKFNIDGSTQHDWLDLPDPRSAYFNGDGDADLTKLFDDCKQVHEDNGVNFAGVHGINLMFNAVLDCCAWGGGAGSFAVTWMPPWSWGTTNHGVMAQEMGHSIGLPHEGCRGTESPYDSNWDPMSSAGDSQIHINAAFKDFEGWIDPQRKFVWDGTPNQTVTLERLALPEVLLTDPAPVYLLAEIPKLPLGTFYTVEARLFAGYDDSPNRPPFEAVVIHDVDWARDDKDAQVVHDNDGNTNCNDASGAWIPGELFVDEDSGVSIAVVSKEDTGFTIAINPDTDVAVRKSASPAPVVAGEVIEYTVTVDNLGPGIATHVVVTDTLPVGTTYISNTDSCVEGPVRTLTCTLPGTIGVGATRSFKIRALVDSNIANGAETTITNTVNVIADQDTGGTNNTFSLTTAVISKTDLRIIKDCKPDATLWAGDWGTCTIWVDNLGPSTAKSVVVTDAHISNKPFEFGTVLTDKGACAISGGNVVCNLGNLAKGARATIQVPVKSDQTSDINDCATVSSLTVEDDSNTANNQSCDSLHVEANADLSLTKTVTPDPVIAGNNLTYTLTVSNLGPSIAKNVVVRDTLPSQVSFVSAVSSQGNCSGLLTCNLGDIAKNGGASITLVVKVNSSVPNGTVIYNNASVSSATFDPDNANDNMTATSNVTTNADIAIVKTSDKSTYKPSTLVTYTITVGNYGPSDAHDVIVIDTMPIPKQAIYRADNGGCTISATSSTVLNCNLGSIAKGATKSFQVYMEVKGSRGNIDNKVDVSTSSGDSNTANNTSIRTVKIGR